MFDRDNDKVVLRSFESLKAAAEYLKTIEKFQDRELRTMARCISSVINEQSNTACGYIWKLQVIHNKNKQEENNKALNMYDKNNDKVILKTFKSVKAAADYLKTIEEFQNRKVNTMKSCISHVITGRSNTACGYIWKYKNTSIHKILHRLKIIQIENNKTKKRKIHNKNKVNKKKQSCKYV